ncbi:MAG: ABC transporter permease [Pirellulaceae bacterium]|nr:ABC transporter permease [Pirellulaceae bacterium]
MNVWSVVLSGLRHYWQVHLATLLAVAVTTAVLTGALSVGDSMRGSLRDLTQQRLGPIEHVVLSTSMLDRQVAVNWAKTPEFLAVFEGCYPTLHFPSATLEIVERPGGRSVSSNGGAPSDAILALEWTSVAVWAVDESFAPLHWGQEPFVVPQENEIVLNATAARRLGLQATDVGAWLTVRIGKVADVPAESFLATKHDAVTSLPRLKLAGIIDDDGVGRLGLSPGTEVPANVFIGLENAQRVIPAATRAIRGDSLLVNALLVTRSSSLGLATVADAEVALQAFRPSLLDAGIKVTHVQQGPLNYYSVSSARMMIDAAQQELLETALLGLEHQSVLTYLANDIQAARKSTPGLPFSMVSALGSNAAFSYKLTDGRLVSELKPGEMLLNRWAAEDLELQVGEPVRIRYYEPETVDAEEVEREAEFRLVGIADLTAPTQPYRSQGRQTIPAEFSQPPTAANDPWLTPEVPGVTDAASIDAWDLPFETASKIRPQDDDYWENYRTTPKGILALADGQALWSSRFGNLTSYRIPAEQLTLAELEQRLATAVSTKLSDAGFQVLPVKLQGMMGSQGSTPFDVLFLLFSMFVMISALLLLFLFVRLGLQQRAKELGLWLAVGFSSVRVGRLWWAESVVASVGGVTVGSMVGVAYAGLMIWLLRTAWVGAVSSPFLNLHWTWRSILIGSMAGLLVSAVVIRWSIRQAATVPARALLEGRWESEGVARGQMRWWCQPIVYRALLVLAICTSLAGLIATGDAQAVAFMLGGMLALLGILSWIYARLVRPAAGAHLTWTDLGRLNLARQPARSLLIIGLVGIATFLILAVSAFRLSPTERGTAGFDYLVQTDTGILQDLNSPEVRQDWLSRNQVEGTLETANSELQVYGFRFHDGEHASCNNPFQAGQPQVLGVGESFVGRFEQAGPKAFAWVAHTANDPAAQLNPWRLLQKETSTGAIPVVIDKNTAWYSLKVYLPGTRFKVDYPGIGLVEFELVGLLDNSVLQGALLVSEQNFVRLFPRNAGSRYYLVDGDSEAARLELQGLGRALKDSGWQMRRTEDVLANYLAVQNTYLSAFQSLGSLGLLLGTVGLVVAQYRSILERRRELALMQALGFSARRIQNLVTRETLWLLSLGFGAGLLSAAVGVFPHLWVGAADVPLGWLLGALGLIAGIGWLAARMIGNWALRGNLLQLLRNQ